MKPIAYFLDTPATRKICNRYGDWWQNMELADRLCIVRGLANCLFATEGLGNDCSLVETCTEFGYEFGTEDDGDASLDSLFEESAEHLAMVEMLHELDKELDLHRAANLIQALLQHELLTDQNKLLTPQAQ